MHLDLKTIIRFFAYILISLITVYYMSGIASTLWFFLILILYWFSKDEPFWLAFFLILSDGFLSFFGTYQAVVSVIPGMPAIEVAQFYIILSVIKAFSKKSNYGLYYKGILYVLGIYALFLIALSFLLGIDGNFNVYLRLIKTSLPFLLFFSIPRLFTDRNSYIRFFAIIFPIVFFALAAQIFEIVKQQPLSSFLGSAEFESLEYAEDEASRAFYNPCVLLLSFFGSLYFGVNRQNRFNGLYLNIVTICVFAIAFLSATRGWTLALLITYILHVIFVLRFNISRLLLSFAVFMASFFIVINIPVIKQQIDNAFVRISTVEKITEGDYTAGGTNKRITERGPRVMKKWKESPVIGLGYSQGYQEYFDVHVGNQNVLLYSGLIGLILIIAFLFYFSYGLVMAYFQTYDRAILVFICFLAGWFFLHSAGAQQFGFIILPANAITQVLFFCFGAYLVAESKQDVVIS